MSHHHKAIALIFVFLLAGHDCARIHDYGIASAASVRYKYRYKLGSGSQLGAYAREVCPMSYDVAAVQERYHMKVTKLFEAVHTMEGCKWTTAFLWKLHHIGLRLKALGSCVATASRKPGLLETLTDSNAGLLPVLAQVMHRVKAQLRQRGIFKRLETATCKVRLGNLSNRELRKWVADSGVDVVKSVHMLLFGADCDVNSYMSSLGLSTTSRTDLLDIDSSLIMMANKSLHRDGLQTTENALQKAKDVLKRIPSESHDDYGDDEDAGTITSRQLDHGSHLLIPHENFLNDEEHLLLQHTSEKSAFIEEDVQRVPPDYVSSLDVIAYLGQLLGIFVLMIALVCVIAYGIVPVVNKIASYVIGGGNDMQNSSDDQQRHESLTLEHMRMKTRRLEFDTTKGSARSLKRGHGASLSRKGFDRRNLARSRKQLRQAVRRR